MGVIVSLRSRSRRQWWKTQVLTGRKAYRLGGVIVKDELGHATIPTRCKELSAFPLMRVMVLQMMVKHVMVDGPVSRE